MFVLVMRAQPRVTEKNPNILVIFVHITNELCKQLDTCYVTRDLTQLASVSGQ